ncbi:hypothetical protein BH10PLA2_BH10PLA2_18620 [soil metagenome]
MTAQFFQALDTAQKWLLSAELQAAVLCLVVLLVQFGLRGRLQARWRFALWLLVLTRLAIPMLPFPQWNLVSWVPASSRTPIDASIASSVLNENLLVSSHEESSATAPSPAVPVAPPIEPAQPQDKQVPRASSSNGWRWLPLLWVAGVLLVLARQGRLLLGLHRLRRNWRAVINPAILEVLHHCRQELGETNHVGLFQAESGCGPATCGIVHPVIVLPARLLMDLSPTELRLVLLHELAHIRRRDLLIDRAAILVAAIHWFNPASWLALAGLRREREAACDEAVLRRVGVSELTQYGHMLLRVAGSLEYPAMLPGAAGAFFDNHRSLVRRIHMIANYRKPTAVRTLVAAFLFLTLSLAALTSVTAVPSKSGDSQALLGAHKNVAESRNLSGTCKSNSGDPLAAVELVLYRRGDQQEKVSRLEVTTTDSKGRFQFRDHSASVDKATDKRSRFTLVIRKPGYGSIIIDGPYASSSPGALRFTLRPAATLQGRVTDPTGKPVADAMVWAGGGEKGPIDGVLSTRTGADGRFSISDMAAWGEDARKPKPRGDGGYQVLAGCYFDVLHPDFAHERPMYRNIPDTVDVRLQPAGAIEGRVVDQVAGRPAAGVAVWLQGTTKGGPKGGGWQTTRTDAEGKYRLTSLVPATYNLCAHAEDRACVALDSFAVRAGKPSPVPELKLVEGGWIEGRLVDVETGKPLGSLANRPLQVACYGPGHPQSGAVCQSCQVDEHGTFRLHVAPGLNYPYIMQPDISDRMQRREFYDKGIGVQSGEITILEFRILPTKPLLDPPPGLVRIPMPLQNERAAAALIRQLGGWYKLDADGHVVEVNMVYYETADNRNHNNDRKDTDKALRAVSAFPRLERLLLTEGQATDEALKSVASLKNLEILMIVDAHQITDAGIRHLAGLRKLKGLEISNGKLGDGSLQIFGRMPQLESLGLQGNSFSDDGLKQIADLKNLQSLWIGMNRQPITDAGAEHLLRLPLKNLDLQGATLSKRFLEQLKKQRPEIRLNH